MGMTIDESIENLVLLKKIEDYLGNISGNTNSVESQSYGCAIDIMRKYQMMQADYNARLKADLVAMLTEIQLEIEELPYYRGTYVDHIDRKKVIHKIQQKIKALEKI